jgi:hypothetical protein
VTSHEQAHLDRTRETLCLCHRLTSLGRRRGCYHGRGSGSESKPTRAAERSVVVAIVLPQEGRDKPRADAMASAVRRVVQARAGRAGTLQVNLREVDSADARFQGESEESCQTLATRLERDPGIVAIVGPAQPISWGALTRPHAAAASYRG